VVDQIWLLPKVESSSISQLSSSSLENSFDDSDEDERNTPLSLRVEDFDEDESVDAKVEDEYVDAKDEEEEKEAEIERYEKGPGKFWGKLDIRVPAKRFPSLPV